MKIVVASGKGGTGKTTIATNLALVSASRDVPTSYCDCDVEAPNGHIFIKPEIFAQQNCNMLVPYVNPDQCDGCGTCGDICNFSAIVVMRKNVLTYPELCHSCGGCVMVCPNKAITEVNRKIGIIENGKSANLKYVAGRLDVGQASAVPLIKEVKSQLKATDLTIIDAPPGTSCPVIETLKGSDYTILVTEPTPFGLNDLKLAVETVRKMDLQFGVIINRSDVGDGQVEAYCLNEKIEIIGQIPFSREIAEAYSKGYRLIDEIDGQHSLYSDILDRVEDSVSKKMCESK
jgi:MinD superfamily P-loop ATPase